MHNLRIEDFANLPIVIPNLIICYSVNCDNLLCFFLPISYIQLYRKFESEIDLGIDTTFCSFCIWIIGITFLPDHLLYLLLLIKKML